jgi:PhoPQ-activated pathogenicity-related protein
VARTDQARAPSPRQPDLLPTIHVPESRRSAGRGSTGFSRRARHAAGIALAILLAGSVAAASELVDFVTRSDPATRWLKQSERESGGAREIIAELVSQAWRGVAWRHELRVVVPPRRAAGDLAVLVVGGDGAHGAVDERRLAEDTGVITAYLRSVPNQPLFGASEDALIAYSFEQYLRTNDPDWPLLFPMTKAAAKAMDAIPALVGGDAADEVRRFVVTGASKRGWTSWLAAVADPRVTAVAPMVFDNLDFGPQMKNQMAVWGRYSEMLGDYTERSLQALIGTERGRALVSMVDPFAYRATLARVSKLVVNGSNDPYWDVGAVDLYWDDLGGPKALVCVPNAGHDAGSDPRSEAALVELIRRTSAGRVMPELSASDGGGPPATIRSDETPQRVLVWRAESRSRDLRSARWRATEARREGDRFVADVAPAADRYTAWFAEAEYPSAGRSFKLSTPVRILPPQAVERGQ